MEPKELVILGLQVSIWATVFGFGLSAKAGDLSYLFRHTNLLARSIVAMLVVMPVVAIILARVFRFEPGVEIAMVALALSPVPPLLPNKETKSGGSGAFAVGLLAILGLVSIFTVPASLEFLEGMAGRPLTISRSAIAGVILKGIIAPLLLGLAITVLDEHGQERERVEMRALSSAQRALGQIGNRLIDLAPAPSLVGVVSFNHDQTAELRLECREVRASGAWPGPRHRVGRAVATVDRDRIDRVGSKPESPQEPRRHDR